LPAHANGYNPGVTQTPVRIAVVNDYELVVAGLEHLLGRYRDRLEVCQAIFVGDPVTVPVQVGLYDLYGRAGVAADTLRALVSDPKIERVAVFGLDLTSDLIADGRMAGASGFISKALGGDEIADALVRLADGEEVIAGTATPKAAHPELAWPGKGAGLTERESQVLTLRAEGRTNREIAAALYLSAETVKSYVAQLFSKLEVRNRVEATNYVHRARDFDH
jgi:DNA-binding NarL/FixJ family response regulator